MAATKYQVFYRYGNPNSNQLLTNDSDSDYEQVFEMYHEGHKLLMGTPEEQLEASEEKSKLIIDGNNTSNDNYQMLFKFAGTKRINKKVWKDSSIGYVISNDWKLTIDKKLISRAVDGDYSGDYLLVEGDTIENGLIVAKENPLQGKTIYAINENAINGEYFENTDEILNFLQTQTIAKLKEPSFTEVKQSTKAYSADSGYDSVKYYASDNIGIIVGLENYNLIKNNKIAYYFKWSNSIAGYVNGVDNVPEYCYAQAFATHTNVETYEIPAHYEEDSDYPYIIRDTYKRIEQSPWFLLSTHSSLQSALEKAKGVVNAIGLENVKVIKVVPTEQFVRIN